MPEFIIEPDQGRIALSVSAKVGCVTLRMWLWKLAYGVDFDFKHCIFRSFQRHTVKIGSQLPDSVELAVAVHRDGVSRLRAVYDHRILRKNEAPAYGIEHFARHLPEYCALYPSIRHHCRPQSDALGSDQDAFTDIVPLCKLDLLLEIARPIIKSEPPPLPHFHRTEVKTDVPAEAETWFTQWTAHDTALGWDGKTLRIFGDASTPGSLV